MRHLMRRLRCLRRDDGRISILIAGMLALLATLILGGVDATAVQLSRMQLLDACDAAAADAADTVDDGGYFGTGGLPGDRVPLTDARVRAVARDNVSRQQLPAHVTSWGVVGGTGATPDGAAVVRVRGNVRPPLLGGLMSFFDADISITVESRGRADVQG